MGKENLLNTLEKELARNKEHAIKFAKQKNATKQEREEFAASLATEQYFKGAADALQDVLNLIKREL